MSALDDILKALAVASPVRQGWEREVLIGVSARRSIEADCVAADKVLNFRTLFPGVVVRETKEFDGWTIEDRALSNGRRVEVAA